MLAKDCYPCYPLSVSVSFAKDCCTCLLLFVRKGLQSSFSGFRLQRISVLVSAFACKTLQFFFSYKIAKDYGPCLLLFICKGLRSLSTAFRDCVLVSSFHLHRTDVLVSAFCLQKDCCLVSCYLFAKEC